MSGPAGRGSTIHGYGTSPAEPSGVLDDTSARSRIDRGGMLGAVGALPAQLRDSAGRAGTLPRVGGPGFRPRAVIVLGMGGSAIGADLVRASFADRLRVPILVHREPGLPGWVDSETLVVASSHSGQTEETLVAYRAALERGAATAVVTTGGMLAQLAGEAGEAIVGFEAPGQPRAAVGYGAGLLLGLFAAAGVLDAEPVGELEAAADAAAAVLATNGPDVPTDSNRAKRLAVSIADRVPAIVGAEHLAAVAHRWRTQLNENAKIWALSDEFPELDHNSVVGYGGPAWTSERMFVVALRAGAEDPRVGQRRAAALDVARGTGTEVEIVDFDAPTRFGQTFAGVAFGDLVSVYVALLRGLDPTPVEAIARLKVRLAEGRADP